MSSGEERCINVHNLLLVSFVCPAESYDHYVLNNLEWYKVGNMILVPVAI